MDFPSPAPAQPPSSTLPLFIGVALLLTLLFVALCLAAAAGYTAYKAIESTPTAKKPSGLAPRKAYYAVHLGQPLLLMCLASLQAIYHQSLFGAILGGLAVWVIGLLVKGGIDRLPQRWCAGKVVAPMIRILMGIVWTVLYPFYLLLRPVVAKAPEPAWDSTGSNGNAGTDVQMINDVLGFSQLEVRHAMTPRPQILSLDVNDSFEQVKRFIQFNQYSRMPVQEGNRDNVVGVLYAKDLLAHLSEPPNFHWQHLMREPLFLPLHTKLDSALNTFKSKRTHFAISTDEHGGTAGIITLEDVLEEIVGEIRDEYDDDELPTQHLGAHVFKLEGGTTLPQVVRMLRLGATWNHWLDEHVTLGGLISSHVGYIPQTGQTFVIEGVSFTIEEATDKQVLWVRLEYNPALLAELG